MKLIPPKIPRLKPPKFDLPHLPELARPRLFGRGSKLVYLGAGVFALGALSALVAWPMLRSRAPVAAARAEPAREESKPIPVETSDAAAEGAEKTDARETEARPDPDRAAVAPPPSEVETLVRRLQDLQGRVASGDAGAYAEMPRLLRSIAQRFLAQPVEAWSRRSNARALVLYLLSGGQPALGRKILAGHTLAPTEERLAKGAVAYLEGADGAERGVLLELDPRALDPALGAQVAFVQATLLAGVDREKALAQLDLARLLAPGGLVEEAALRREVGLLSETPDFDKFAELARQYWSRFRQSPYGDNFLRQFVAAAAHVSVFIRPKQWLQIDEFLDSLSVERRLALYLVMAQTAAVAGNSAFADLAAQRAYGVAAPDSIERRRALLYRAAAAVGGAGAGRAAQFLRDVARDELLAADQPLYDATTMASARIFRAPEKDFSAPPPDVGDFPGGELARAEACLRDAGAALADSRRSMERQGR